jgi:hypothetical protein
MEKLQKKKKKPKKLSNQSTIEEEKQEMINELKNKTGQAQWLHL